MLSTIVFFGTVGSSLIGTVVFGKRLWTSILAGLALTLAGWMLMFVSVEREIVAEQKQIAQRAAQGIQLSMSEQMYDGVGDRVAMVCMGWLPGAIGSVLGIAVSLIIWPLSWRRQWGMARGFDIMGLPIVW